jgi:hypothetical protein
VLRSSVDQRNKNRRAGALHRHTLHRSPFTEIIKRGDILVKNTLLRSAVTTLALAFGLTSGGFALGDELPAYMKVIVSPSTASAADIANRDVLQLNVTMFDLYGEAGKIFQKNILAEHPIILALFSGAGGRLILYRPNMPPLEAPSVPIDYQLMKSVGHSTMAISEVVMPFLENTKDKSWMASMQSYRSRMKSALDGVDAMTIRADWRENSRIIIKNNLDFMDECLAKGVITQAALDAFAKKQGPVLKKNIAWAAQTQVGHWMGVVEGWKKMLGASWDNTYGASNTIYVARQNNILFSVLAQYFGPDAINDRLMLIETVSFTTTPQDMLESMVRIISDRSVGSLFFGNYHVMDYELMGGDARAAVVAESEKRGMKPFLPPLVPFGSKQWPTLVTPGPGPTTLADFP